MEMKTMAESHVVSALRQKRAEVAGQITATERRIGDLRTSLVHLDATLRLFDDGINPEAILAKLPKPEAKVARLPHGDLTKAVLDTLRQATAPLTKNEVADRVAEVLDLPVNDRIGRTTLRERVEGTLFRQRDRRVLSSVKDGPHNLWRVAE
jgi:hypothetical protein